MHKQLQDGIFHLGQTNAFAVLLQCVVARVHHKGSTDHQFQVGNTVTANTTEQSVDPGRKFCRREGFGNVVVCAGHKARDRVHFLGTGCEHDDTHLLAGGPDPTADFKAIDIRQHNIQDRNADVRILLELFQSFFTGASFYHFIAGALQVDHHEAADILFIFQNQDFFHKSTILLCFSRVPLFNDQVEAVDKPFPTHAVGAGGYLQLGGIDR